MALDYTDEQINDGLKWLFEQMQGPYRQYTGPRIVIAIGRKGEDTIEWDGGKAEYEPLTVVMSKGASYVSRQFVPVGAKIDDTKYWARTLDFDGQLEQYRQTVERYKADTDAKINDNVLPAIAKNTSAIKGITDNAAFYPGELFGSVNAALAYSVANNACVTFRSIETDAPVTIPSGANVRIGKLTYSGTSAALIFDSVENCDVYVDVIVAEKGSAIAFDCTTAVCQRNRVEFNTATAKVGISMTTNAAGNFGIMDNAVNGVYVKSTADGILLYSKAGWVGQNVTHVNRIEAGTNAIHINVGNSGINSAEFGYVSFEQSTNGLLIEQTGKTSKVENISGSFRAREVSGKRLTVMGSINMFKNPSTLTFDAISAVTTDFTGIKEGEYSYGMLYVEGAILDAAWPALTSRAVICSNKGLSPVVSPMQFANVSANYASNSFAPISVFANVKATVPAWVSAVSAPWYIALSAGYTVTIVDSSGKTIKAVTAESSSPLLIAVRGAYIGGANKYFVTQTNR